MLLRGGVFWAPALATNRPEYETAIGPYVQEDKLRPGVRFRFNVANLTAGESDVVEYPGEAMPLPHAVHASVSVPVMFEPVDYQGMQFSDGLTIDGCPLEELLLSTGIDRAFVIGVAPRTERAQPCENAYQMALRAGAWNQYSEVIRAIEQAEAVNETIRMWQDEEATCASIIREVVPDAPLQGALLEELAALYAEAPFPYERKLVDIIPILPEEEIPMWLGDFDPERSRRLIEQGRRDALRVLEQIET